MSDKVRNVAKELWWVGLLEGIAAIVFGIAALFWPGMTLLTLVYLFSAYVVAWAIFEIIHGLMSLGTSDKSWISLVFGIFALGVGVYLVRHPHVTFATFILLIGFVFIVRGIADIVGAFLGGQLATSRVLSIIMGALALVIGVVVLKQPVDSGVAFVWLLGLFSLIYGPICLALAFDLRKIGEGKA